jgi:hypothetical protein
MSKILAQDGSASFGRTQSWVHERQNKSRVPEWTTEHFRCNKCSGRGLSRAFVLNRGQQSHRLAPWVLLSFADIGGIVNIGQRFHNRGFVLPTFTWLWFTGSVVAAACFAFLVFPNLFNSVATVWFQAATPSGSVYWPNTDEYRKKYLSSLADTSFLYISNCDALPQSQKPNCDLRKNWSRLSPAEVECKNIETCGAITYRLSQEKKSELYTRLVPLDGHLIDLSDVKTISLSNPAAWGDAGKWPVFFVTLFFGIKLGRALGEFLFTPYGK